MGQLLWFVPFAAAASILAWATVSDIRRFTIPNEACLALLALWPVAWATSPAMPTLASSAVAFVTVTVIVGAMWVIGLHRPRFRFGGGDWKLLSALAPWAGLEGLPDLLLGTALAGGVFSIFLVVVRAVAPEEHFLRRASWTSAVMASRNVPYGVAICLGGLVVLFARAAQI